MINKKIMQINITCGVGSTGRISEALYYATKENGYDVAFAYSAYTPTIKEAFRIENRLQNILRRGLNKYIGRKQKHSTPGTKRLIRYIKKEKPDLIHLHNVQQNSVNYPVLFDFLKKSKIPAVYTLHDCWAFTGGCYHFTRNNCTQYQIGCHNCKLDLSKDDLTISTQKSYEIKKEKIGENENIYPVGVSQWLCNVATKSYMGKMQNLPQLVYNGIDTDTFYPRNIDREKKYGINKDTFVILGVASYWDKRKDVDVFLRIAHNISFSIKIILIGGGLDCIRELNDDRFICVDRTENVNELAEYYSLADVFINASKEETFGLTTAEALACGTPAIVYDSTACPEVVDKQTGIVVSTQEDSELFCGIEKIKRNGKSFYSTACRARAVNHFSKERMINEYIQIYRSIFENER